MSNRLKSWIRQFAYDLGLMGALHRLRNRRTLTVFMFHRVLPGDSVAYRHAEKEFTFSLDGFERALDFIAKHYQVVDHDAVKAAVDGQGRLPSRAALITFDDGWRDTLLYARAPLARRGMKAVLFLATEVPTLKSARWWQDQVVQARCDEKGWHRLLDKVNLPAPPLSQAQLSIAITVALSRLTDDERHRSLDDVARVEPMPRQMLFEDELPQLAPVIALAGHGHSHAPLSAHPDALSELVASHQHLQHWGGDSWSMSFPHGAYDERCLALAREAGFTVCFTSDPVLMRTGSALSLSSKIGRIHLPENQWTCERGRLSHPKLATYLFLREHAS